MTNKNSELRIFLRLLSKKGFFDILSHINDKKHLQYNEILDYAISRRVVDSNASVTIILNGLSSLGLLERTVITDRPVRTSYSVTKTGKKTLKLLHEIENIM